MYTPKWYHGQYQVICVLFQHHLHRYRGYIVPLQSAGISGVVDGLHHSAERSSPLAVYSREHSSAGRHTGTHVLNNLTYDFRKQGSGHVLEWDVRLSGNLFIFARSCISLAFVPAPAGIQVFQKLHPSPSFHRCHTKEESVGL